MQTGMVIVDPKDHTIVDVNPTAADMFGADLMDVIGSECHAYICSSERNKCPITDLGQTVEITWPRFGMTKALGVIVGWQVLISGSAVNFDPVVFV